MPLDKDERTLLIKRVSELVEYNFGYGAGRDKYPTVNEAIGSMPSHTESGFLAAAETLLLRLNDVTGLLATLLERALGDAEKGAPEQPDVKPKNKGGRPPKAKEQPQAQPPTTNGAQSPQPPSAVDEMFPTDGKPAADDGDPFGLPGETAPQTPAAKQLTDVQVKDALRAYMNAFGTEGSARLTDLLTRVAGVKRFTELPASKWGVVVEAAQKELAGR